ncbi:uncharacterized protein TNCV_4889551 [Trichonephila clavipes]|nr:uncharacterized protein TNCV_4889551 [Trichonephila clavipes]
MLENLTPVQNESTLPENVPLIETVDLLLLLSHFLHVPNTPIWTGFNSKIIKDTSPKQKVSYLTPINFSPTNVAVVKHTMEPALVVGKECNQTYVQVTYDLTIAKVAYKIQSTSKTQFNNLFIHLGSFHLKMAFFKVIGVFINECGLSHMMIESNIIAFGSVNGLVEEVTDSYSSMPIELPNNVLSRVLSAYQKFVEETRQDHDNLKMIFFAQEPTLLKNQNTKQDDDYDDIDNNVNSCNGPWGPHFEN